jgi:hypothetical protein
VNDCDDARTSAIMRPSLARMAANFRHAVQWLILTAYWCSDERRSQGFGEAVHALHTFSNILLAELSTSMLRSTSHLLTITSHIVRFDMDEQAGADVASALNVVAHPSNSCVGLPAPNAERIIFGVSATSCAPGAEREEKCTVRREHVHTARSAST